MKQMRRSISLLLVLSMIVTLLCGCSGKTSNPTSSAPKEAKNITVQQDSSCHLSVGEGVFQSGSTVTVTPLSGADADKFVQDDKYNVIGTPVSITCDTYDGTFFNGAVRLTVPISDGPIDDAVDLGRYVLVYYDETTQATRYLLPDSFDCAAGTMTVTVPHFSGYTPAELDDLEQIDLYLDKFCGYMAATQSREETAAANLAPYVEAKLEALKVSEDAKKALTKSVIKAVGGELLGNAIDPNKKNATELGNDLGNLWTNGVDISAAALDGDEDGVKDGVKNLIAAELIKYANTAAFGNENSRTDLNAARADAASKLLSNVGNIADITARLQEGDVEGAMKTLGSTLEGLDSKVELGTRAVAYLGAKANEEIIDLKSNGIEELFQVYKNGRDNDFFKNNSVEAMNDESFLDYLNYGSLGAANLIRNYYNQDKLAEVCKRWGVSVNDFDKLPQNIKDTLQAGAQDALMNYFHARVEQEEWAAELKREERKCIADMMGDFGVLRRENFSKFFGEESPNDFDINARLEKIEHIRHYISRFVDEDVLWETTQARSYNYGYLVNHWVSLRSTMGMNDAEAAFLQELKEAGLLNDEYKKLLEGEPESGSIVAMQFTSHTELFDNIFDYIELGIEKAGLITLDPEKDGNTFTIPGYAYEYDDPDLWNAHVSIAMPSLTFHYTLEEMASDDGFDITVMHAATDKNLGLTVDQSVPEEDDWSDFKTYTLNDVAFDVVVSKWDWEDRTTQVEARIENATLSAISSDHFSGKQFDERREDRILVDDDFYILGDLTLFLK